MDDNKKWVYDSLKSKGVDMGSYEDYDKALNSEDSRKWVYDSAKKNGIDMGSYDDFNNAISPVPASIKRPADEISSVPANTHSIPKEQRNLKLSDEAGLSMSGWIGSKPYKDVVSTPEKKTPFNKRTFETVQADNAENYREDPVRQIDTEERQLKEGIDEQRKKNIENEPQDLWSIIKRSFTNPLQTERDRSSSPDVEAAEKRLRDLEVYKTAVQEDKKYGSGTVNKNIDNGNFDNLGNNIVTDVKKGIGEIGRKLPETLRSIGTFGLSGAKDAIDTYRKKGEDTGPLERQANELYDKYTQLNKLDDSIGRDIASVALKSADYAAQFAATGGMSAGATEGLGKIIASKLGGKLAAKAAGGAVEAIGNAVARTTVMPSTYSTAVDIMNQTGAGFPDAWGKSFTQNVIENFSEVTGEFMPSLGIANKTKIGRVLLEKTKGFRHASGIQGFPQEFAEEQISTILHSIAGDGQGKWSDLVDPRNQLTTAGVLAVMQIPHVSIVSGSYMSGKVGNKVQNYSINKAYNKNLVNLQEQFGGDESADSGEIVDFINKSIDNARNGKDMDALLDYVVSDESLTDNQRDAIAKYALAYNAKSAMIKGRADSVKEQINAETEDIKANSNPSTGEYTEANRLVPNEVGEFVPVPGYIVGYIGDTPLWKPEGSGPEESAIPLKPHEIQDVQSMPVQDVIDASAQMIQEKAKREDDFDSKYDPQIQPPSIGSTFIGNDGAQIEIVQQNPNGGWIANRTVVDEKGKQQTQVVELADDDYYNAKQQELDIQEDNNLSNIEQENEVSPETEQSNVLQNEENSNQEDNTQETPNVQEQQEVPASQVIYKKDAKGNDTDEVDYEAMPVENTISHLNGLTGNDEATAKSVEKTYTKANATLESARKSLDKIEGEGVDYTDRKEVAAYQKAKEAVRLSEKRVEYWSTVNDEVQSSRVQPGDKTAEAIRSVGDPVSGEELAATMLANGNLPILFSDYKKETGYSNSEGRKMVGLFANKEKGGMTVQEAGEKLMVADQENGTNFFDQSDPNAGRNAIIEVLSHANTRGDLFNYIQSNREALAERERQAEYNAYSTWADENYHMTPEEYESYEEILPKYLADKVLSDDEYNQFMYNFADEQLNNNKNDNTGRAGQEIASDEQRGIQADGERSSEVLPEEQPLPTGRGGESETGSIQVDENLNNQNDSSQRGSSTGEITGNNVLNNGEESISSQSNNTGSNVRYNQEQELPADERLEQERSAGREENARAARRLGSYRQVRSSSGRDTNSAQEKELESYAKEKGIWLDAGHITEVSEHKFRSGAEADVYLNKNGKTVTKVINYSKYSKSPLDFIDNRVLLFNSLFNSTPYTIVGFTRTDKGFSFVVEQPYIKGLPLESPMITGTVDALLGQQKRVADYMKEKFGMIPAGLDAFSDGDITIQDVHLRNVIQGEDGNLYVIDAVPSVKEQQSFVAPEYKGGDLLDYAEQITKAKEVHDAGKEVDTNPTEAQKEAGNYKMGHVKIDGLDITIENPKGSTRSGVDKSGKEWSISMNNDYGYIRGTKAVDGDHIDVFLGPNLNSSNVYVVDQVNPDSSFDESKVMYGFDSEDEARKAYLSNYEEGWQGLGNITEASKEDFKKWIDSSVRKTKPFAEYSSVKAQESTENTDKRFRTESESTQEEQTESISNAVQSASEALNTPVIVLNSAEELPEDVRTRVENGEKIKGWYDPKTGEVVIYAPNATSVEDVNRTILHEVVGHKGLRTLFGDKFDGALHDIYKSLPKEVRAEIAQAAVRNYAGNTSIATEEYLSKQAERGETPSWWNKVVSGVRDFLRKMGMNVELSDNDVKYLLWRSRKNLENGNLLDKAEDIDMRNKLGVGEYEKKGNYDGALQVAKDFSDNHAGSGSVFVAKSLKTIRRQLKAIGIEDEDIDRYEDWMKKNETRAFFSPKYNRIIVLDTSASKEELNSYLWHESTHKALSELEGRDDIVETVSNFVRDNIPDIYAEIESLYNEDGEQLKREECTSFFIEALLANGKELLMNEGNVRLRDKKVNDAISEILNAINNGSESRKNKNESGDIRGRRSEGDSRLGNTEVEMRNPGIEKNGIRTGEENQSRSEGGRVLGQIHEIGSRGERVSEQSNDQESERGKRFRIEEEKPSDGTREAYENALNEKGLTGFQAKEAYQDSMLSLKILQDAIAAKDGSKIKSFENAYLAENRMSSVNTREMEVFAKDYFRPLVEEVARMIKEDGVSYRDITNYLIAKHGLERNKILAERDAEKAAIDSGAEKGSKDYEDVYKDQLERNLQNDYSGLTGLRKSLTDKKGDPTEFARNLVETFEKSYNTDNLWKRIKEATGKTLRKSYESGMMSKDTYEGLNSRFKNYVPLRGWDETMADEVYNYLEGNRSPVNSVMKNAGGRTSLADDPIATIGNMAESTILEGNRNLMKQHFLNFVTNHPSDLATIRDVWYVKDNATGEMTPSYPTIPENATPDEIVQAVDKHEEKMKGLEEQKLAQRGRNGLDLRYKILPYQKSEHTVTVKRNGKEQVVYINANPRVAQALNGKTNPDVESNPIFNAMGSFNRALAKNFTTRNPAFVLSNLSRDLIFAHSAVSVKESPLYFARFSTNVPISIATVFKGVRGIEDNSEAGKYFKEFLNNGGETGYANLRNVDRYKKMVQNDIKHLTKTDYFKAVRDGAELFSDFNRIAENISRFNTYLTSRQEGKDVVESIKDAKEITVNFNKKGAGYKSLDPKQKWYSAGNMTAYSAGAMRSLFLFFNAGVQSLANFGGLAKKSAAKLGTVVGAFSAAGFMMPFVNRWLMNLSGDGDDQDYYQNLTEWTRRNNLCIYIPYSKGEFVTIPLPIELRAFFGLGDLAYQSTIGNSDKKGTDIAFDALNQLTELLPLNPLGNNGDIVSTVIPDALKPVWQVKNNLDFTGRPIFKENDFNKTMPEWTKTYKDNSKMLIKLSEWSNEIGGGDKYKASDALFGLMNWNPAKVEHVLEGYFGGMATTLNQTGKTLSAGVESIINGEKSNDLTYSNAPVLNRFIKDASDDRSSFRAVKEKFYNYLKEYEETEKNLRGYTNEVSSGNLDYLQKLIDLQKSKDFRTYATFKALKKPIDRIRTIEKKVGDENSGDMEQQKNELIRTVVHELDKVE